MLQYVWRIQELFPILGKLQFTALVSMGAVGLFIVDRNPARRLTQLRHRVFRPILAIFALAVLSVPFSVHAGTSFDFLTGNFIKTVVLVGILAASIRDRHDIDRLIRFFVAGALAYITSALALAVPGAGRLGAGSYDPNDLGLFTVSTIPLCVYLMRKGSPAFDRVLGVVTGVMLLIGSVNSGSRGGFLALVAVATYGLLGLDAVKKSKRLAVTVLGLAVLTFAATDSYWERMQTILTPQEDYNWAGQAPSGRIEVWKRGLTYMAQRPLLGVGVDAYAVAEGTMAPIAIARRAAGIGFKWSTAHSSYVQVGVELGVFGLAAFVTLLALAFVEARRVGREAIARNDRLLGHAFAALFVSFTVGGAFLSQAYATFLYFAIGMLIGLARVVPLRHAARTESSAVRGARRMPIAASLPSPIGNLPRRDRYPSR